MKKHLFWLAALAVVALASCAKEGLDEGGIKTDGSTENTNGLTTVKLASFAGNAGRVTYPAGTRADEAKTLELIAEIANPSKAEGFNFTKEDTADGRYMSATSIYYNGAESRYYVTYHMQGNNYNTTLDTDTAGAIDSFSLQETTGDDGKTVITVKPETGFRAANPKEWDFDFNHIYFDNTDQRIIAVGHNVKGGNMENTQAIVGVFNPTSGEYKYTPVKTHQKAVDKTGKELDDYADAGDVNCILRVNDTPTNQPGKEGQSFGYNVYLAATREGMAVLHADEENMFKPFYTEEGERYFVKTPGSAKYVAQTNTGALVGLLYLSEDKSATSKDVESEVKIALVNAITNNDGFNFLQGWNDPTEGSKTKLGTDNIETYYDQTTLPANIKPIDGKNTLTLLGGTPNEKYAALGANGMYYYNASNGGEVVTGVKKFDNRPVNCVVTDVNNNGMVGYLYVANGSKLTILNKQTLEEVASYNAPSKEIVRDENGDPVKNDKGEVVTKDLESSANFITVNKAADGVRTVTVAFGQAGVKVFKFIPPTK